MDGYFLFKQKLVCHLLTPQDQHAKLFKGANKKFAKIPWQKIEAERHNKDKSAEEQVGYTLCQCHYALASGKILFTQPKSSP